MHLQEVLARMLTDKLLHTWYTYQLFSGISLSKILHMIISSQISKWNAQEVGMLQPAPHTSKPRLFFFHVHMDLLPSEKGCLSPGALRNPNIACNVRCRFPHLCHVACLWNKTSRKTKHWPPSVLPQDKC